MISPFHIPVMADEVIRFLDPQSGETFVDATAGSGGHALLVGQKICPGGALVLFDQDPAALQVALDRLGSLPIHIISIHDNFRNMADRLSEKGIGKINGLLLDLGVSSFQLDTAERGFSFRHDAPLDMRMDPTQGETAADLIARLDERELVRIIRDLGEDRWAVRIAKFIVEKRGIRPIETTAQLAEVVEAAVPRSAWPKEIHVATRTFQAIRLELNQELAALQMALDSGANLLAPGGRMAVISYHSLEDRIVKKSFARLSGACQCPPGTPACRCGARREVDVLTRKPVMPGDDEITVNPRARSAKLRAVRKLG